MKNLMLLIGGNLYMTNDVYLKSGDTGLVDVDLESQDLFVDLDLDSCVAKGSNFINFGTSAPTANTPGRIYIQIQG